MMPECALYRFAVGGIHGICSRSAGFPDRDEGGEDLPIPSMVVICCVTSFCRTADRFRPGIPHVVGFAGVVPSDEFNEIRLHAKNLSESDFEILLATTIPIRSTNILVLEGGESHHEGFAAGGGGVLVCHVVGGGDGDVSGCVLRPGVPIEGSIEGGVSGEEGRGGGFILEGGHEVDGFFGGVHYVD